MTTVAFKGLGIGEFTMNRFVIDAGIKVAWYGLIIVVGMLLSCAYVMWRANRQGIKPDSIMDIALAVIISGVIGARLYYVLTSLDQYDSFFDAFKIWEGGLGIYGGIIAGVIALLVMCRVKKLNFMQLADFIAPAVFIGQCLGRWGNFVNGEAFGAETTLPWGMTVIKNGVTVAESAHPTFLYESLWTLTGFLLAHFLFKHRRYNGQVFYACFAWYGFGRMFIELLRTDSLYICSYHAWFTKISVLVGFALFVICTTLLVYFGIKGTRENLPDAKSTEPKEEV